MTRDELVRRVMQVRVGIITPDELFLMCTAEEWMFVLEIQPDIDEYRE